MVGSIVAQGYRCTSFDDFDTDSRHLLLRHDIDLELECAVDMAHAEASKGWQATYFVLLGSEFYNVHSASGRTALLAIAAHGHEIGLHFDRSVYSADTDLDQAAKWECDVLANLVKRPVRMTAAHRPAAMWPAILGSPAPFAGRPHAYQARYFCEAGYVSDSAGWWYHGHPSDHPALAAGTGLQLLTHPYLWSKPCGAVRDEMVQRSLLRRAELLEAEAVRNFTGFAWPGGRSKPT